MFFIKVEKNLISYSKASPIERKALDEKADAEYQMQSEYEERIKTEKEAVKDPNKAEFIKMMKSQFPNVPISFK